MAKKTAKRPMHDSSKAIWVILVVVSLILLFALLPMHDSSPKSTMKAEQLHRIAFDFGNQTIKMGDDYLMFKNGSCTDTGGHNAAISHSSVNPSGRNAAAILTDETGRSGKLLYVVGASLRDGKEIYSEPVLIGDRVNIVSVTVDDPSPDDNGVITVKYFDRAPEADMVNETRQETTKVYAFEENGNLVEIPN